MLVIASKSKHNKKKETIFWQTVIVEFHSLSIKEVSPLANAITGIRIICSFALLFFPALSVPFFILYITAGFIDMIDGTIARKTGTASEFGARFDTAADFIMVAICLIKLIPILDIKAWMYSWIGVIAMIKVINVISGIVGQKKFVSVHSAMNKITGGLLFVLPLTLRAIDIRYSGAIVCAVATAAAVQEGHYIRTFKEKT